jgi:hypothetical protein
MHCRFGPKGIFRNERVKPGNSFDTFCYVACQKISCCLEDWGVLKTGFHQVRRIMPHRTAKLTDSAPSVTFSLEKIFGCSTTGSGSVNKGLVKHLVAPAIIAIRLALARNTKCSPWDRS